MSREPSEAGDGAADGWRGVHSRRTFLRRGTLTAAAIGVAGSIPGMSAVLSGSAAEAPAVDAGISGAEDDSGSVSLAQPLLAHVKDIGTGEISLFQGEQEVVVHDPALARSLLSAVRP